jgi:hypothetical protein
MQMENKDNKMIYVIYEYDKDYHKVVDYEVKEFSSDKKADRYCKENEGGGYRYFYLKEEAREKKNDRTSDNIISSMQWVWGAKNRILERLFRK